MQLNVSIDEELHGRLQEASRRSARSLPDLTRALLRAAAPETEKMTVKSLFSEDPKGSQSVVGRAVEAIGQVSEVPLVGHTFWAAVMTLTTAAFKQLVDDHGGTISPTICDRFMVTTENGRQGMAMWAGTRSAGAGHVVMCLAGITALS